MRTPILRQRAFYQACLFSSFSMFWTSVPIELARRHGFSQTQIGLFALMGAAGVIAGPIAGRLADSGYTRAGTRAALWGGTLCMLLGLSQFGSTVVGLGATALLLDFCMQFNMVLGQRAIYSLPPESRSRLNALYMTSLFVGGAVGSALASGMYAKWGWQAIALAASVVSFSAALDSVVRYRATP
jgi:predicted MFS family arabinose efflux permease